MFILNISGPGASDSAITDASLRIITERPKEKPPQPRTASLGSDGFVSYEVSELALRQGSQNNDFAFSNYFGLQGALNDNQIARFLPEITGQGRERLESYLQANHNQPGRFMFIKVGEGNSQTQNLQAMFDQYFPELKEQYERIFRQDKESRELERVFAAMTFSASNPKAAIQALGSLLSVLKSPEAISLAGGAISDIASFAASEAIKRAKYDPNSNEAKQLVAILGAIAAHCNGGNVCGGIAGADGHAHEGGAHVEQPHVGVAQGEPHADRILVFDTHEGKFVDNVDVVYLAEIDPNYGCEEVCDAANGANINIENAEDVARSAHLVERQLTSKLVHNNQNVTLASENLNHLEEDRSNLLVDRNRQPGALSKVDNEIAAANRTIAIV